MGVMFVAYLKSTFKSSHLNVMQLFSVGATILKKCFAHENVLTKLLSKAAYFMTQFEIFSTANQLKTSTNLIFCSIKMAHRGTYIIMTWLLLLYCLPRNVCLKPISLRCDDVIYGRPLD